MTISQSEVNTIALAKFEKRRAELRKQYLICLRKKLPKTKEVARELGACEEAIALLRQGFSYGQCKCCLRPIHVERLRIMIFTFRCFACQRVLELTGNITDRAAA